MPEEKSPTFPGEFEAAVAAAVTKVLVLDAAKGLWHYVASRPPFAGFEKIVDFYHAAEHLSTASEALFGKGTARAQAWAAKHRTLLLSEDGAARRVARAIRSAARRALPAGARKEAAT